MTLGGQAKQADIAAWRTGWTNFISVTANAQRKRWELLEVRNGVTVQSRRFNQTILPNVAYNLRVEHTGAAVRVYINGVLRLTLIPTQPLVAGDVGMRVSSGMTAKYEFVKIY